MELNKDNIEKQLRDFTISRQNARVQQPIAPDAPAVDPEQDIIDKFKAVVPTFVVNPKFVNLPRISDITDGLDAVKFDFPDDCKLKDPSVLLVKITDLSKLVDIGRSTIPMISSGFSPKGVGNLFLLAYHLVDPSDGSPVFGDKETPMNQQDKAVDDLCDVVIQGGSRAAKTITTTLGNALEAQVYSYIAASTLRLFTKSSENYVRAFNHIEQGYKRFYGQPLPMTLPKPTGEAIRILSHLYSRNQMFKSTLFRILYIGGGHDRAAGLRNFLYEMHLANTGMHIVSIFDRLCNVLNCEPGVLMKMIMTREYARQIEALVKMLELSSNKSETYKRKMWKYGRIFDERFMAHLQTKSCPQLVYMLASALKRESRDKTNQDILNIAQLADVSASRKKQLEAVGEVVVKMVREQLKQREQPQTKKAAQ